MWSRSAEKCGFRYVTVISVGDSKGYNAAKEMKPYGEGIQIEKVECSNHVAKRLGKGLLGIWKKTGMEINGNKEGSLTKDKILKLKHISLPPSRITATARRK